MTSLPARNIQIRERGQLMEGYFADVVVFDPATVLDHATFPEPHQYATGVEQGFGNGEHTGATPRRVVCGPGWAGWSK